MKDVISINLFESGGIDDAIEALERLSERLQDAEMEISRLLATIGVETANIIFTEAAFDSYDHGNRDFSVAMERIENGYVVKAEGEDVLFIEFGAGITYGYGHPEPLNFGPGTYPGKGHWNNPKGWWYPDTDGKYHHTMGNRPYAPMYTAMKKVEQEIPNVVRKVLTNDYSS